MVSLSVTLWTLCEKECPSTGPGYDLLYWPFPIEDVNLYTDDMIRCLSARASCCEQEIHPGGWEALGIPERIDETRECSQVAWKLKKWSHIIDTISMFSLCHCKTKIMPMVSQLLTMNDATTCVLSVVKHKGVFVWFSNPLCVDGWSCNDTLIFSILLFCSEERGQVIWLDTLPHCSSVIWLDAAADRTDCWSFIPE